MDLVVFHASGLDCAFPLETVKGIVPMAMLSTPPGLPSCLAGFLNLRGTAIPILRLDRLFNLPEQLPGLYTPLIILRAADSPAGVLVASVRRIASVTKTACLPLPEGHILLENEHRLLAELQAMEQERLRHIESGNCA